MHRKCTEKPQRYIIYPFELAFKGCFKPNCYSVCLFFLGTANWLDSVSMLQTHGQHDKSKETNAQTASKFETHFFVMSQAFPRRCVHFFGKHGTTGCWFQPPWKILNILDHDPKCAGGNAGEQDLWNQQPSKQLTGLAVPFWNRWVSFFCLSSTVKLRTTWKRTLIAARKTPNHRNFGIEEKTSRLERCYVQLDQILLLAATHFVPSICPGNVLLFDSAITSCAGATGAAGTGFSTSGDVFRGSSAGS